MWKRNKMDLFETLRNDILTQKIENGAKLTEQNVCNMYGVSRTPVREAFQKLELDGLIDIVPNKGAYVRGLSLQDIKDMYELRKAYEVICVQFAIDRITDEEMEKLRESYDLMEFFRIREDSGKFLDMNTRFHQIIYNSTGNRMLQHVLTSYQVYTKNTKLNHSYISQYYDEVLEEHKAIYEAIANKDKEAAKLAAAVHMDNSRRRAGFSD